jgi:hypothetical protein
VKQAVGAAEMLVLVACMGSSPATAPEPDPDFHLYLLIGQSNMAGRGKVDEESLRAHPRVVKLSKDLKWEPATDPLHFDKPGIVGVGPGLSFGKLMAEACPQARIGLIPCAVGGTSIRVWVPGAQDKATRAHPYDDMLRRTREAQGAGVLKGILWHQGEADRGDGERYGERLVELIARLRHDLNAPDVPFVAGELAPFKAKVAGATKTFNEALQGLAKKLKNYACVSAGELGHKGDEVHFSTEAARELGKRYTEKVIGLQKPR